MGRTVALAAAAGLSACRDFARLEGADPNPGFWEARKSAVSTAEFALESARWVVAPDFEIDVVASGFQLPVGIAVVPNAGPSAEAPLLYVAELHGTIKVVQRNGVISEYATGLVNFAASDEFPGAGEQGLGGAVVDPYSGDLYVTLVYQDPLSSDDGPLFGAIDRLTSSGGGLSASGRTRILDLAPEPQGGRHQVSNITFGPDGYLYVHVGDGENPDAAQNLTQFRGKILRLTRDGSAVSRNPYWDPFDGISARDYIFASGVGNAFGGAWRLSDGAHYFVENGPTVDRFAKLAMGRNYGYDGRDESMANFALFNWNPATAPINVAFLQEESFDRSGFPAEYQGLAYVTQSGPAAEVGPGNPERKAITEWAINEHGELITGARAVAFYVGDGASTTAAIAAGPDGLYFSDLYAETYADGLAGSGANIFRLRYTPPPPPADCNHNDVPDDDDLALGDDCNRNGVPDECDISALSSSDCNLDAVPDECEVASERTLEFSYGVQGFILNGSAQWVDGALRLTPATGGLLGSAVYPPISAAPLQQLRAEFDFRIGGGSGADGLSFAIFDAALHPASALFGEDGPVPSALVIKLNTYDNGDGANDVQVMYDGQTLSAYTPSFQLRDHETHTLRILFHDGRITLLISSVPGRFEVAFEALEVPGYVPFVARVGFGARTGGYDDEHVVDNFTFWVPNSTDRNDSGIPDSCECVADVDDGQGWGVPDGNVDRQDLEYYVRSFLNEDAYADVDDGSQTGRLDGVADERDLDYFLRHFIAGC
jgi:glucose/arabinose dehydrogenase